MPRSSGGRGDQAADPSALETESIIRRNLAGIRGRIERAAARSGRPADAVRVVAVTKRCPIEWVGALVSIGERDLGENYPQELWSKAGEVSPLAGVRWHLIGHLQSNKARRTWPLVEMIHAVDSLRLLRALEGLPAPSPSGPAVCLQLNLSGEPSKHGWSESSFFHELDAIGALERPRIVGLMTMAAVDATPDQSRRCFERLRQVREEVERRLGRAWPELSMGMSGDFEAAAAEGSTLVRIGSALFEGLAAP